MFFFLYVCSAGGAGLNQLDNDMDMADELNPRAEVRCLMIIGSKSNVLKEE